MTRRTIAWSSGAVAAVLMTLVTAGPVRAVIIRGGDGSGNTTAPADDPGWANVGAVGSASGIYLGNRWMLTAAHVWANGQSYAYLDGAYYTIEPGSAHRLHAPDGSSPVDLELFRLSSEPVGLDELTISSSAPVALSTVLGIGNGQNRAATDTWWNQAWTELPAGSTGTYHGYHYGTGRTKRWGENKLLAGSSLLNYGYGDTYLLRTSFDSAGGPNEMQAAIGDSGGALFYKNGSTWELAGVILAVSGLRSGQPGDTAIFGDLTYYADLSRYREQIQTIVAEPSYGAVPEPSSLVLLLGGALGGAAWYGWRRGNKKHRAA